jgi:hypothetical protein
MSGSERSGASTLQAAMTTAKNVARYATPMGLLASRFNFMQTFSALTGSNPAVMQQSPDPAMKMLFSMLDTAGGGESPEDVAESADAAVATALKKEVAAVVARLARF